jgi:hypothetical protein
MTISHGSTNNRQNLPEFTNAELQIGIAMANADYENFIEKIYFLVMDEKKSQTIKPDIKFDIKKKIDKKVQQTKEDALTKENNELAADLQNSQLKLSCAQQTKEDISTKEHNKLAADLQNAQLKLSCAQQMYTEEYTSKKGTDDEFLNGTNPELAKNRTKKQGSNLKFDKELFNEQTELNMKRLRIMEEICECCYGVRVTYIYNALEEIMKNLNFIKENENPAKTVENIIITSLRRIDSAPPEILVNNIVKILTEKRYKEIPQEQNHVESITTSLSSMKITKGNSDEQQKVQEINQESTSTLQTKSEQIPSSINVAATNPLEAIEPQVENNHDQNSREGLHTHLTTAASNFVK